MKTQRETTITESMKITGYWCVTKNKQHPPDADQPRLHVKMQLCLHGFAALELPVK